MKSHINRILAFFFLIASKSRAGSLELSFTSFPCLCNKKRFYQMSTTASEELTVERSLAWGSNRSDPRSRSPSLPLVGMCVALAHLRFSMWMGCLDQVERSRVKRVQVLWKWEDFNDRHWYLRGLPMKHCSTVHDSKVPSKTMDWLDLKTEIQFTFAIFAINDRANKLSL